MSTGLAALAAQARARWNEKLSDSGRAVQARTTKLTYEEYSKLRGNSWDHIEFLQKLDDEALPKVAARYLSNCARYEVPGHCYDEAVIATVMPLLLKQIERNAVAVKTMALVDVLRANEGSHVGISSENAEGTGDNNNAISVIDDWTGWVEETFYGKTVVEALEKAVNDPRRLADEQLKGGPAEAVHGGGPS